MFSLNLGVAGVCIFLYLGAMGGWFPAVFPPNNGSNKHTHKRNMQKNKHENMENNKHKRICNSLYKKLIAMLGPKIHY